MLLDYSQINQISAILVLAIILFMMALAAPPKTSIILLMLLVPYQTIETKFGSSSVVLAYVVFLALLLKKERIQLPLLPHFIFFVLWCLVSMSFMHPSTYTQHGSYIFVLISAFLVFWLCYFLIRRLDNPSSAVNVFLFMNVFVVIYCAIQLWIGPGERLVLFGISEISMTRVRGDGRLSGPFESAEITAQYFVLIQFLVIHQFWYTSSNRTKGALIVLSAANLGCLVATGSRGEFLLLLGGVAIYLWLFRRRLGVRRTVGLALGGTVVLILASVVIVNLTPFGNLFNRLGDTEFDEQYIPDTRQKFWPIAAKEIAKSPIIGHGPRLRFHLEERGHFYEEHVYIPYPHNQYLFLLFTIGLPGLVLFMVVIITIFLRCFRAMSNPHIAPYFRDLARTGVIVIVLYIIDGMKIDQMRMDFSDYWHFSFGLFGLFVAVCEGFEDQSKNNDRPVAVAFEKTKSIETV
jgi:O-antigen ligase